MQPFYSTMPKAERDRRDAALARLSKKFPSLKLPAEPKPRKFPAPVLYTDAEFYQRAGFRTCPVELSQVALDREFPAAQRIVMHGLVGMPDRPKDFAVGILGSVIPIEGKALDDVVRSRIGFVRLDISHSKRTTADLLAIVERYLPGAPVRLDVASCAALIPFRIGAEDPHLYRHWTVNPQKITGDPALSVSNKISVDAPYACFLAGGDRFTWRNGVDLLAVGRDGLTELTVAAAGRMYEECNALLLSRAPAPKLTAEQKRRAAIAARLARR